MPNHAATNGFGHSHGGTGGGSIGRADEFGFIRPGSAGTGAQYRPGTGGSTNINTNVRPGTTGSMAIGANSSAAAAAGLGLGQPITSDPNDYGFGSGFGTGGGAGGSAGARPRQRTGTLPGAQNRLTIVNAMEDEIPEEGSAGGGRRPVASGAGGGGGSGAAAAPAASQNGRRPWMSAEDEKARLYQQAKAEVERVQGGGAVERTSTPPVCSIHTSLST